ncbi:ABC transporter ATP-binding protein [Oceanirhabdus sp. W0125-5]|uniref:ABC transporter ATP-binding protein n=1 Tax=Oceanirhabdus sp. W0125-5 TaxID=2999116 RepID=UPI0022F314F2|nr:ABC transporter ATP-binding protein [Oceanirhabdus sp. W0125-5]WBW97915.1 ABC transporter ATP-binding protein [Oceanirhabdus sp. W0125-5]
MKKILNYISKYWTSYIIPVMCMLLGIGLDMLNPKITGMFIDDVIRNGKYDLTTKLLIGIIGIAISRSIFMYVKHYRFDKTSSLISRDLKKDLFNHIQSLSFSYFDKKNTGELMSRVDSDVDRIWETIGFGLALFIENILYFIIASICLFSISWKLTLIALIPMPLLAFTAMKLEKEIDQTFEDISDNTSEMNTIAQENLAGVRLVKAFAREKHELSKFFKYNKTSHDLSIKKFKVFGKYFPLFDFLSNICILLVIVIGGIFVIKGNLSVGELVQFNLYAWMIIWPMRMLGWLSNMIAQANASSKKIFKIMDTEPEIKNKLNAIELNNMKGHIKFNNVTFKYDDEEILKGINLDIAPGSTVAIMGSTGSGKSTLTNLIGRYYDTTEGSVTIDGFNVKDLHLNTLRSQMAVVPQDVFLFSESIEENIKFACPSATLNDVKSACEKACAKDFIESLEEKYDTVIGERGIGLSGGQKQRLSIARALIKNSKILVLDDSTSALDMDTEFQLLKNIYDHCAHMTTIIIAHRISAVKNADMIVIMEDGKIAEYGNHTSLIAKGGKYYDIYREQFKDLGLCEEEVV